MRRVEEDRYRIIDRGALRAALDTEGPVRLIIHGGALSVEAAGRRVVVAGLIAGTVPKGEQ